MTARDRRRKHERRRAHAERRDNRRPADAERLSTMRAARREERRAFMALIRKNIAEAFARIEAREEGST